MKKSEKEKMLSGLLYDSGDPELVEMRVKARDVLSQFNRTPPDGEWIRKELLKELLGSAGENLVIEPPFYCDYGIHIEVGDNVYFNFNCVLLDVNFVKIGDNSMFGPGVHIYTSTHPMNAQERRTGLEMGYPITIGNDVWVGGSAIICPKVTIGDRVVIGAGSVVTRDIPPGVFAAGNPCKVIREM